MSDFLDTDTVSKAHGQIRTLIRSVEQTIRGKHAVVEQVVVCLLAGGHVLLEDAPGVGKTTLAYALARSLDCAFSRIQFTSDMLPGDITGVSIFSEASQTFVFRQGPVFSNIVLADEVNRATPKTQSALLEVMDRARVTVDGQTHPVGSPFMVFATQNPLDYEGTFRLPESQLDRFLMRLHLGYPEPGYELEILRAARSSYDAIDTQPVLQRGELLALQGLVQRVFIEDSVLDYLLRLVTATRTEAEFRGGISVRGGLALKHAAQARALAYGRDFVIPDDVAAVVKPVFVHRLALVRALPGAAEERTAVENILNRLLTSVAAPQ